MIQFLIWVLLTPFCDVSRACGGDANAVAQRPEGPLQIGGRRLGSLHRLCGRSRLTAIQAAHVGLVYNLARRILHVRDGEPWESWTEENVFGDQGPQPNTTPQSSAGTPTLERKLKVSQVWDQGDDGEFCVETEDTRAGWLENAGNPQEDYLQAKKSQA